MDSNHIGAYGDDAPIAAFATPLAESALAIIRTSGSIELLAQVFSRPEKLLNVPGNSIIHGWIIDSNTAKNSNTVDGGVTATRRRIDEVLISVYRAPLSYTGENGADISCHGGISAAKAVMAALKAAGFRDALPGEFTFRAFMNGKLDLTRSESVMELVSAKTNRGRERAVNRLSGALEQEITAIKKLLVQVLAETEIYLDYSEEEVSAPNAEAAGNFPGLAMAEEARDRLQTLAASYRRERLYQEGALAVIAGRPNAGKSSLFNLLLKEDRSIVTDIPGTTRDWIEALVSIEGIPVRLADTAGLRGLLASLDPVEKIGIERSRELLAQADLVLYVIDGAEGITAEDQIFFDDFSHAGKNVPIVLLWNKADIAPTPTTLSLMIQAAKQVAATLPVSAKTGMGIPALTAAIAEALTAGDSLPNGDLAEGDPAHSPGIATARQKELVDTALSAVTETLLLAAKREPLDLIAPLLREAVNSLGEITGEVSTADILETMFSRFCVGK